jgi:hypothetical protein
MIQQAALAEAVATVRKRIQQLRDRKEMIGEENTKATLIEPVFSALASVVRQKSFDIRLRIDGWQFFLLRRNVSVAQTGALHMNAGGVETYLADADAAGDSGDRRRNSHWLERLVR